MSYACLARFATPLSESHVTILLEDTFNARSSSAEAVLKAMESMWLERVAKNPLLFNQTKFRLHGCIATDDSCVLQLGLCDYKSFITTNCSTNALVTESLLQEGAQAGDASLFLANPLGNVWFFKCPRTFSLLPYSLFLVLFTHWLTRRALRARHEAKQK